MAKKEEKLLGEEFLYELFYMGLKQADFTSMISSYIQPSYLPDREFQDLLKAVQSHYKAFKTSPSYGVLLNKFSANDEVLALIGEIRDTEFEGTAEELTGELEEYIKDVKLAHVYEKIGSLYNKGQKEEAQRLMVEYGEFNKSFSLAGEAFTDIGDTLEERHAENKVKNDLEHTSGKRPINRFYIDDLDALNRKNLRGQVACFLAPSGVGKSHAAIHIGKCSAMDGFHVLHFQLEGSKEEVNNAYSGALAQENAFNFEKATFTEKQLKKLKKQIKDSGGSIKTRSYPRFNNTVSTIDINNGINEYRKKYGYYPDVVLIDSIDLLTDASGLYNSADKERFKRIAVVNDLKDISMTVDCFFAVTTQANINDRLWLNDPKNVLTEFNAAEAKGIVRPLTWLISLNQTDDERVDNIMRLHVAKSRFTKKGGTFKIATDYDNEVFYDRDRSMNIQRVES